MPAGAAAPAFGGARDAGLAERGESEAVRGHQKSTSWFGLPVSREDAPVEGERPASTTEGESDGLLGSVTRYLSGRSPQAPPEPPEWACGLTAMQRFQVAVGLGLASGLLFAMALFVFLPMVIFVPGKFALSFSIASVLLIMAVAFLRGPRKTLTGLVAREKAVFTAGYMLSLCEPAACWRQALGPARRAATRAVGAQAFASRRPWACRQSASSARRWHGQRLRRPDAHHPRSDQPPLPLDPRRPDLVRDDRVAFVPARHLQRWAASHRSRVVCRVAHSGRRARHDCHVRHGYAGYHSDGDARKLTNHRRGGACATV